MVEEIHKGDIDTKFLVTFKDGSTIVDISTADPKQILFKDSSGTVLTKTGVFETDGTDGKLYYKTISSDLSKIGIWSIQGKLTIGSGTWNSSVSTFTVYENLE